MSSKKFIIWNLFSKRLKDLIKSRLKISQKTFSDIVGVSENYLSMVLNEKSGPSADMIAGIYLHYNDYLEWLLTGDETRTALLKATEAMPRYGDAGDHRCEFCGDMPDEIKKLCKTLKEIVDSKHPVIVPALLSNLEAFKYSVDKERKQDDDIQKLKDKVRHLEKLLDPDRVTGTGRAAGIGTRKKKT